MTRFFSAFRPDMTRATRDRVWTILGLDRFTDATALASDHYVDLYNEWLDRCFVAVLDDGDEVAKVLYRALQARHLWGQPRHVVWVTYEPADIAQALQAVPRAIMDEGLQEVLTDVDLTSAREFLIRIMVAMDKKGWDHVTIQFH